MSDDAISVIIPSSGKPTSEAKLAQLAEARKMALVSRKQKQRERLERKLQELRAVMGDMSHGQIARVATAMMAQEETLRGKQNDITERVGENIQILLDEMGRLRHAVERATGVQVPHAPPRPGPRP